MKKLLRAFFAVSIIAGTLASLKLFSEIFGPNLRKYYSVNIGE